MPHIQPDQGEKNQLKKGIILIKKCLKKSNTLFHLATTRCLYFPGVLQLFSTSEVAIEKERLVFPD
jgi:hypothetical protein